MLSTWAAHFLLETLAVGELLEETIHGYNPRSEKKIIAQKGKQ